MTDTSKNKSCSCLISTQDQKALATLHISFVLIQMFKIMNKMDKCDRYNRFKIILNQIRGNCFKYFKEITRQPYRENFFYNRIVNIWNQLPSEIVEATPVKNFKAGIDHWMSSGHSNQLS
jgi:hypothetical protein